jgi:uroporphyrin-III C-methyltransferase/precorrin-2 dehydrogenase/sirohydrochlorin ferrochelatase
MLALERAGVSFDVVPGVTSALAAPALAGIPVTHRGVASGFLVVSGHDAEAFGSAIGQLQPNGVTLVVMMGLRRSAAVATALIGFGWSRATPAAIICDASLTGQSVWRGTLRDLAAAAVDSNGEGAGTIVIGEVVAVGQGAAAVAKTRKAGKGS